MKLMKTIGLLVAMLTISYPAHSYSFGDLRDDIGAQTKLTILRSATPGYFYNVNKDRPEAGVITSIVEVSFISADAGWITPFDASKKGTGVLGGSIHFDRLIALAFPETTQYLRLIIPQSAMQFWNRFTCGVYVGHDFEDHTADTGFYSGLTWNF